MNERVQCNCTHRIHCVVCIPLHIVYTPRDYACYNPQNFVPIKPTSQQLILVHHQLYSCVQFTTGAVHLQVGCTSRTFYLYSTTCDRVQMTSLFLQRFTKVISLGGEERIIVNRLAYSLSPMLHMTTLFCYTHQSARLSKDF